MSGIAKVDRAAYHADTLGEQPTLSSGTVKLLCSASPAHAWHAHPRLNPEYAAPAEEKFDLGTAAHSLLLEGEAAVDLILFDDWRGAQARKERDASRAAGRVPLLAKQWEAVQEMVAATRTQLESFGLDPAPFTKGVPEVCVTWEEDGVHCRALVDWLHDGNRVVDDYKTTSATAEPGEWARRSLFAIGGDIQAAWYLRGLRAATGLVDIPFRFVVAETKPPHAISVIELAPAVLELANEKIDHAIGLWRKCLADDHWPAYPTRTFYADLPAWMEAAWVARESRGESYVPMPEWDLEGVAE